jgi:predicted lipoprotein
MTSLSLLLKVANTALAGAALLSMSAAALAATPAALDNAAAIQSVYRHWAVPQAAELVAASARLTPALQAVCEAPPNQADAALRQARAQWLASVQSWERLSAVAIGPLIERRSQRQIDFSPTRPRMIEKAVQSAPASAADMELIGTPAKGFPALEWLLWVKPIQPASPECRYAVQLAAEIGREAQALDAAYRQAADRVPDAAAATTAMSEWINQWVGGIERLRWPNLEMPVRVAITSKRDVVDYPRRDSGAGAAVWAAEWSALRTLAASSTDGLLTLESILRGRGAAKLANALAQAVRQTDRAMQDLTGSDRERVLAATGELAALKRLVETDVAPALGVSIGFSDADGD